MRRNDDEIYSVRTTENHFTSSPHYPQRYGSLNRNVSSFKSNENFPLDSLSREFNGGIRRIRNFYQPSVALNIPWIGKGEEKEGTFRDNSGSLPVLLTSFHGQRDLENGRFIAVQRD